MGTAASGRLESGTHGMEWAPSPETGGAQARAENIGRSLEAAQFAARSELARQDDGPGPQQRTDQAEPGRVADRLGSELFQDAGSASVRRELQGDLQVARPSYEQPPETSLTRLPDAGKANSAERTAPSENAAEQRSDEPYAAMHKKLEPYLGQADKLNKAFEKDPALFGKLETMEPGEADARLRQVVGEPSKGSDAIEAAAPSDRRAPEQRGGAERDNPDDRGDARAEQAPQRGDPPKSLQDMKNDVDSFRMAGERAKFVADARAELKAEVAKQNREDYFDSDHGRMVRYLALRDAEFMRRSFNREDTSKIEIKL